MITKNSLVKKLTEELENIDEGSITLLVFNAKDYSVLTHEALNFLIRKKDAGVAYIAVNRPYRYMLNMLKDKQLYESSAESLLFIDCITYMANMLPETDDRCVFIQNPASLEEMNMYVFDLLEKLRTKNKILFIDSLSTLLLYNDIGRLKTFLYSLVSKLRLNTHGGLFIIVEEFSADIIAKTFTGMCDSIVKIE